MNRTIQTSLAGVLLALGTVRTQAGSTTTNYWVQPVNFTLKAYITYGNAGLMTSLGTKQFLGFLSGLTNTEVVASTFHTDVTNCPFLPTNNFPATLVVSNNYVVSANGRNYTNNVSFANHVVVTEASTTPVTYVFANTVGVASNVTAFLTSPAVSEATAVLVTTNGPGTVFSLWGTNYGVNPNFASLPGAKLVCKTPVVVAISPSGTNITQLNPTFSVRYGSKAEPVDVPVNTFLSQGQTFMSVNQIANGVATGISLMRSTLTRRPPSTFTWWASIPRRWGS